MNTSLKRTVGLPGAVLLGLGSILGTGAFVGLGLAVGVSGSLAPYALLLAGLLAACNALSSAQLAAAHPVSGGTYAYGRKYLNATSGFIAGSCFLLAKSASAAAAGLGLVAYLAPGLGLGEVSPNLLAAGAIILITALVALGLRRANIVNTVLVGVTLIAIFALIVFSFGTTMIPLTGKAPVAPSPHAFAQSVALLFVAFTGYGRIATLGEEVTAPRVTIPRAIMTTIVISTALYFGLMLTGLNVLGTELFADVTRRTQNPLLAMAELLENRPLFWLVSIAAATAMAGVTLNLLLGLSRVVLAMGRAGDLPSALAKLSPAREPIRAVWLVGVVIAAIALFGGIASVWSFSSFTVLIYYAITNTCALRLPPEDRLYPRMISWIGLAGCAGLSVFLDWRIMLLGSGLLLAALLLHHFLKGKHTPEE